MTYDVTLASYLTTCDPDRNGPIPGTENETVLSTESGLGLTIWHGYLEMRTRQNETGIKAGWPWAGIELTDKDPEKDNFREAINLFLRFLAGEGRDNCQRVYRISEISTPPTPPIAVLDLNPENEHPAC